MQREARAVDPTHARFAPLDGMRALAALLVSMWHFQRSVPNLDSALPAWISRAVAHANLGVDIFFVLSGFAVARSLVAVRLDARALGRFMLRRTVRLDPPYAVTLFAVVALAVLRPAYWPVRPTLGRVLAHLLYLQGILGLPNLLGIFWTLCLEIQLYLALALLHLLGQRLRLLDATDPKAPDRGFTMLLSASAVAAAIYGLVPGHLPGDVWFFAWWPVFALGVLVERAMRLPSARAWCLGTATVLFASNAFHMQLALLTALATAAVIVLAARSPLRAVLGSRPLIALGGVSYSFYLMHSLAGGMAMHAIGTRLPPTVAGDLVRLAFGYAASFAAAFGLYRLVEVPAQRWSRRIAVRPASPTETLAPSAAVQSPTL